MSLLYINANFSTGCPKRSKNLRTWPDKPEADDLETQTCINFLPFIWPWWWRKRWTCSIIGGWKCTKYNKNFDNTCLDNSIN